MSIIKNKSFIEYTLKHKKAFLKIEKELLGKNTLAGYLHDLDKVFLYLIFNKKKAHKIHRKHSKHHIENIRFSDLKDKKYIKQMIIDWECARLTKPDKPLNARDFLYKTYPSFVDVIEPVLKELKL